MKTHKRSAIQRIFNHGYIAAIRGKSLSTCPYEEATDKHFQWTSGWREGRQDHWSGNAAFAGMHKAQMR
ncbi:Ribosome modulation factor [BD1-7 clade bacterium]|uniref:Ribosome modulation factor n=1 Tax=BD1-7 clade bacterium TaxID=2029982 RepID=A0A5S9NV39_9GAMM|nr:Ribosome modulation factor [BD1-7 clade bacterium]CAA0094608.1 Ribosome modulation factor [BD1-7 clade bacterium]